MNKKIEKLAKAEGFCCLWAFFKANAKLSTSELWRKLGREECTKRALQQQRARYRDEQYHCERNASCLRKR